MVVRIAIMVLRVTVLFNLITGIIFWTGNADSLQGVHMIVGIIAVLSLWTLGIMQGLRGGSFGLALATFVVGFLLVLVGLFQQKWLPDPANHWIIQVIHLVLGLAAIGLGERVAGLYRRLTAKSAAA
ncbi:MAG TPA: hypothetical protein VFQ36_05655 [Ktedonobacteraceae bacterium]|nr:hypothetical protein [Ktedonobacteraceae bacterium]